MTIAEKINNMVEAMPLREQQIVFEIVQRFSFDLDDVLTKEDI